MSSKFLSTKESESTEHFLNEINASDVNGLTNFINNNNSVSGKLNTDGSNSMTGDLNLDSNQLLNAGSIFCQTITESVENQGVNIETVLIKDGLVDGVDIATLDGTVSTNSSSIGTLSTDKADKIGTSDLSISKTSPLITLKDTVSTGTSAGEIRFTDTIDANIASINATTGNLELQVAGVTEASLSSSTLDMKGNTITNCTDIRNTSGLINLQGGSGAIGIDSSEFNTTKPLYMNNNTIYGGRASTEELKLQGTAFGTTLGSVRILSTNASTSSTTGGFICDGGVGIARELFVGADLNVSGDAKISGEILASNGSLSAPSYSFSNDTDTGLYRYGADQIGVSCNGVLSYYIGEGFSQAYGASSYASGGYFYGRNLSPPADAFSQYAHMPVRGDRLYFTTQANDAFAPIFATSFTPTSDERLKKDINDSTLGLEFVTKLKPKKYRMKEGDQDLKYGFLAQDIKKCCKENKYDFKGVVDFRGDDEKDKPEEERLLGLDYMQLIPVLVKAIQELSSQNEELRTRIEALEI